MNNAQHNIHQFVIDIARQKVGINSVYSRIQTYSSLYISELPADFVVQSSRADINSEGIAYRQKYPSGRMFKGEIESIVLLRKIADRLLDFNTILMHGAVIAVGNEAYLFTAPSGTGKTTHISLWLDNLPEAYVVNGDKPLLIVEDTPLACGTPWCGKERMGTNAIVPLKAIVLMKRADENAMRPLSFMEAFPHLLEQSHRPEDAEKMRKTVRLLSALGKRVALWQFECNNFKDDAFDVAYHALTGR